MPPHFYVFNISQAHVSARDERWATAATTTTTIDYDNGNDDGDGDDDNYNK